ncbi:hypothetical protein FRC17_009072 [Serendipita sp. 399]|nr:hypothetical protein FRC17_009072 [Serendipita sp. 399]
MSVARLLNDSRQFASDATTLSDKLIETSQYEIYMMLDEMVHIGEKLLPRIAESMAQLSEFCDEFPYMNIVKYRSNDPGEQTPLVSPQLQNANSAFQESIRALCSRHEAMAQFWKRQLEFIKRVLNMNGERQLAQIIVEALEFANCWKVYDQQLEASAASIRAISTTVVAPESKLEPDAKPGSFLADLKYQSRRLGESLFASTTDVPTRRTPLGHRRVARSKIRRYYTSAPGGVVQAVGSWKLRLGRD